MLTKINTKERYNKLFWWFEENRFQNTGDYPRKTNLVFEFSDYIERIDNQTLAAQLGFYKDFKDPDDAERAAGLARLQMSSGIDMWLEA